MCRLRIAEKRIGIRDFHQPQPYAASVPEPGRTRASLKQRLETTESIQYKQYVPTLLCTGFALRPSTLPPQHCALPLSILDHIAISIEIAREAQPREHYTNSGSCV